MSNPQNREVRITIRLHTHIHQDILGYLGSNYTRNEVKGAIVTLIRMGINQMQAGRGFSSLPAYPSHPHHSAGVPGSLSVAPDVAGIDEPEEVGKAKKRASGDPKRKNAGNPPKDPSPDKGITGEQIAQSLSDEDLELFAGDDFGGFIDE